MAVLEEIAERASAGEFSPREPSPTGRNEVAEMVRFNMSVT